MRAPDRPRVPLADPPFDALLREPLAHRVEHFALVVGREVLARNRRALLLAGGGHLGRLSDVAGGNVVQRLEQARPGACVVVFTHYVFDDVAARALAARHAAATRGCCSMTAAADDERDLSAVGPHSSEQRLLRNHATPLDRP